MNAKRKKTSRKAAAKPKRQKMLTEQAAGQSAQRIVKEEIARLSGKSIADEPGTGQTTDPSSGTYGEKQQRLADRLRKSKDIGTDTAPHVIVEARAGTGKSTTLLEGVLDLCGMPTNITPSPQQAAVWESMRLSRGRVQSVHMVAFNRAISKHLETRLRELGLPAWVTASTMHSMGLRAVTLAFGRVDVKEDHVQHVVADLLGKDVWDLRRERMPLLRAVSQLVDLCKMNLIGFFGDATGTNTDAKTMAWVQPCWNEALADLASYYDVDLNGQSSDVFSLVPRVLEQCKDVNGVIDYADMIWLPVVLNLPTQKYDILLVDEAQDLNRCQQELAKRAGRRLILCGDPKQCQPPGTLITKAGTLGNRWHPAIEGEACPIENLAVGDMLLGYCPKDGRNYSNRTVEAIHKRQFKGGIVEVETEDGVVTRYTPDHRCYASFGPLRNSYAVYLMKKGLQFRVGSCKLNYGASGNGLVHRLRTEQAEASWLLETHSHKREARLREMEISHRFNLPQVVFPGVKNNQGYILDEDGITRFWRFVGNNSTTALTLLKHYGLEWNRPIAVPGLQWSQSFKRAATFAACNLKSGMALMTEDNRWVTIKVRRMDYSGPVYSLKVSHDQLYMADGIVTHNSIYGFAGADAESMARMERELSATDRGCVHLPLTVTRRCGRAIVREAQRYVPDFEAHESNPEGRVLHANFKVTGSCEAEIEEVPPSLFNPSEDDLRGVRTLCATGVVQIDYRLGVVDGDMILCRVNAPLVSECFKFLRRGMRAEIQGRDIGASLVVTVKKVLKVKETEDLAKHSVVDLITNLGAWIDAESAKERAKHDRSEARLAALRDRHDCIMCFCESRETALEVVNSIQAVFTDDKNAGGIRLSSVHKAKGLEARRVFILRPVGAEMPHPMAKSAWEREQERNLLYVAITRAIEELVWVS